MSCRVQAGVQLTQRGIHTQVHDAGEERFCHDVHHIVTAREDCFNPLIINPARIRRLPASLRVKKGSIQYHRVPSIRLSRATQ